MVALSATKKHTHTRETYRKPRNVAKNARLHVRTDMKRSNTPLLRRRSNMRPGVLGTIPLLPPPTNRNIHAFRTNSVLRQITSDRNRVDITFCVFLMHFRYRVAYGNGNI